MTGDVFLRSVGAGTRGAVEIGHKTKQSEAAQAIPELAAAIPLVMKHWPPERVDALRREEQRQEAAMKG